MPPLPLLALLGLTVLASMYAWSNQEVYENWVLNPYEMNQRRGQWHRFLTSGFLHADWSHLLFNMITLYSFGGLTLGRFSRELGPTTGLGAFLALYLGGIVVSDLPTYFRHRHDRSYRSLGASGGVSSVLFSGILFHPVAAAGQGILIFPLPIPIQPFIFGLLYLAYSYYMGRRRGDNINHDAHFYGALFGVLATLVLVPGVLPEFLEQITYYARVF